MGGLCGHRQTPSFLKQTPSPFSTLPNTPFQNASPAQSFFNPVSQSTVSFNQTSSSVLHSSLSINHSKKNSLGDALALRASKNFSVPLENSPTYNPKGSFRNIDPVMSVFEKNGKIPVSSEESIRSAKKNKGTPAPKMKPESATPSLISGFDGNYSAFLRTREPGRTIFRPIDQNGFAREKLLLNIVPVQVASFEKSSMSLDQANVKEPILRRLTPKRQLEIELKNAWNPKTNNPYFKSYAD